MHQWIVYNYRFKIYKCSNCGAFSNSNKYRYCKYCGERMDGEKNMSGIYIPGMKMPKGCWVCNFGDDGLCLAMKTPATRSWTEKETTNFCPLIPVPDHGRLIDADALRASIKESIDECHKWADEVTEGEMYARVSQALGTFVECSLRIKAALTIIPADKDGAE